MEGYYLGDIELTDETLAHYGVKGMKWRFKRGRRNNQTVIPGQERARLDRLNSTGGTTSTSTSSTKSSSASGSSSSSSSSSSTTRKAVTAKDVLKRFTLTKKKSSSSSGSKVKSSSGGSKSSSSSEKKSGSGSSKASSGSSSSKSTGSSSSRSSTKTQTSSSSSTNDTKVKALEEENKRLQAVAEELANVKQKTQISETYTKYLENLMDKANNKSQLGTDELKKRAETTGRKNLRGDKWRRAR